MFARACTVRARQASALQRIGVVTVAVPLADSAVRSVDEELRMLVAGTLAAAVNGLALGSVDRGGSLSALGFHSPPVVAGDHMLVSTFDHFISRCCRLPRYSADPLNRITQARTEFNTSGSPISGGRQNDVEERRTGAG